LIDCSFLLADFHAAEVEVVVDFVLELPDLLLYAGEFGPDGGGVGGCWLSFCSRFG